jgi:hypothetical protein
MLGREQGEVVRGQSEVGRKAMALTRGWAGFSRSGAGFFRLRLFREILCEKFVNLGGNWNEKSSIPREIRGIGDRKFVAM